MISHALRIDIEAWAARRGQNPLFVLARNGRLTRRMVTAYIANVTYMIRLTIRHLEKARDSAVAAGDERLAAHFAHKILEERGHDKWGDSDLEALGAGSMGGLIQPAVVELGEYIDEMVVSDATLYLTYLAFTEYVTALLGPELLDLIEQRCGTPRSSMTVVHNHVELDQDHAEEGFGEIDDLVGDPKKLSPMRKALATIMSHFDALSAQLTVPESAEQLRDGAIETAHDGDGQRVSAA